MLSATYRMSTTWNEHASQLDPEDRLLWRMPRRRMDAEELRDSLLAVSRELDPTMGGTFLVSTPFQDLSVSGVARDGHLYESSRRSVYLPVLRSALYDVFQTFDFPDPAVTNGDRATTTVASQALFMMNGKNVEQASERLAESLLNDGEITDCERLDRACRRVLGRPAAPEERSRWGSFLWHYQAARSLAGKPPERRRRLAWQGLCRALFSSNEFLYVN
jgi:Protein of unknown function (DUF1553)